jgi:hypothetical protein
MKTNLFKTAFIACVSLALFAGIFSSCKTTEVTTADTTTLTAVIDSCTTLLASTTVATDYPAAAITAFQATLTAATTASANTAITQTAVDNLVVQLRAAKTTFLAAAYGAIPSTALIMGMTFDETVTSNQFSTEGKAWTAVLTKGPSEIFGTATNLPSFVTGKVGKAIYFSNGSHLEISNYTATDLLSKTLSISVWVKPDSTRAGNYIMSYNYWNSWKFQLQEQNKPYFTVKTLDSDNGYVDADNEQPQSAPNKTWTHLVISLDLTNGFLTFYVNGAISKEWTKDTQPNLTRTPLTYATVLPLMVGGCTTYAEANAWSWSWTHTPINWDSFIGAIDELKVYNIALTAGQVAKLYKDENK